MGQGEGTGDRAFILLLFPFLLNPLLRVIRKGPASGRWEQKSILGNTLRVSCSRLFLCLATSNTPNVSIHVIETWVQKGSLRPNEVDMLCVCQGQCRVILWTAPLSHMSLWKLTCAHTCNETINLHDSGESKLYIGQKCQRSRETMKSNIGKQVLQQYWDLLICLIKGSQNISNQDLPFSKKYNPFTK